MKFAIFISAVTGALVVASVMPAFSQMQPKTGGLPADVTELISRRASCDEYVLKGRFDPNLAAEFEPLLVTLRCNDVPKEEGILRDRYRSVPQIIAALDAKWVKVIQRVPVAHPDKTLGPDD
jgi:hypothetical protein